MNRVRLAALNNAHLYEHVCHAHGCQTETNGSFLICLGAPPRFYGQAVTLKENGFESLSAQMTGAFKDSFHDAEPEPLEYRPLFTAQWIWKEPSREAQPTLRWTKVDTDEELQEWEAGWADGDEDATNFPRQFPASLLEYPDLAFFSARKEGKIAGGAIFNMSGPVVGISNAFAIGLEETMLWSELAALASDRYPDLPATGYERESSLDAAIQAGFEPIGPLRVWIPTG